MDKLIFSIIIPTYNRKNIVTRAIDSVLSQNFKRCEIIIVDDNSTDGTSEFLEEKYGKKIKILKLNKNVGQNIARNKGSEVARGEWLIFLDSDDMLTKNSLEHLSNLTKKVKSYSIMANSINSEGKITSSNPEFEGYLSYEDYLCDKIKGEFLPIHRRDIFLKHKFPEFRRAPKIGHYRVIKESGSVYFTKFVARYYNTVETDRLTVLKKNKKEFALVWQTIIKERCLDKLKFCPIKCLKDLIKLYYYKITSIIF